jgi:transcriptional regulator with XRE-family HTH domain
MNTLGKLLKFRRNGWKMSVKEVAEKIGVTYQCYWQIEETDRVASADTLEKLSKFFYFDMVELLELNYKNTQAYKRHIETVEYYKRKKENEKTNSRNN